MTTAKAYPRPLICRNCGHLSRRHHPLNDEYTEVARGLGPPDLAKCSKCECRKFKPDFRRRARKTERV